MSSMGTTTRLLFFAKHPLFISPRVEELLGPKGLMPSDMLGAMTEGIVGYIRGMQGSVEWKGDKDGVIRTAIAKSSKQAYPEIPT